MKLNIRHAGTEGEEVIILHGLMGSSRNWQRIMRKLSSGFRVIAPDLRNHGESPHGPHSIPLMRDDIRELIETHCDGPPHLIGHSMGGQAAMAAAVEDGSGIKSLTVVDASPVRLKGSLINLLKALSTLKLDAITNREDADELLSEAIPDRRIRQFLLQNLNRTEEGNFKWQCNLTELIRYVAEEYYELPEGRRYEGPTLVLAGGQSDYKVWEHEDIYRAHFPNMEFLVIEEAGHWIHADASEKFTEVLTHFLKNHA